MKKAALLFISFFSLTIWSSPGFSQVYPGASSPIYEFEQAMQSQAAQQAMQSQAAYAAAAAAAAAAAVMQGWQKIKCSTSGVVCA